MAATHPPTKALQQDVQTRRVHYLSGFDPRGARYYYALYRDESAKQSHLNGSLVSVGRRRKLNASVTAWTVQAQWGEQTVTTDYEFMAWDDLVREDWDETTWSLFLRAVRYYLGYAGTFPRVLKVARNAGLTALFALTYTTLCLLGALLLAGLCAALVWHLVGNALVGLIVAIAAVIGVAFVARNLANTLGVGWVLRTCVFIYEWGLRTPPGMDQRVEEIVSHILAQQKQQPVDEVLIVGHSVGTFLAVLVTARLLEKSGPKPLSEYSLLTLGQCIPYLTFIPNAIPMREALHRLGHDPRIPWTDATSPPDPLCFFQVDPIRAAGLPNQFDDRPKRMAVRIFRMFTPATYAAMRRNKVRLHFQYLMASERPSAYDYFLMTAGPHRLPSAAGAGERA